jgi:predicted dehydrogenase
MPKKRFALIGAGLFGEMHAKVYSTYPNAELGFVCDLDGERAQRVAKQYGSARATNDWREIAQDPSIDAVSIATPDFAHTEVAVAMAEAGKHLLVEKPLATTVAECEQIIAAAKKTGVKLMVDYHNRWSPVFHESWQRVRSGELGSPRFVYFRLSNTTFVPLKMLSWANKSSVIWFLGSHALDMTCWLIGEWPSRVYSVTRREVLKGLGVDTPDFYASTFEFPSGAVAVIENVWLLPQTSPGVVELKCEFVGSQGALHMNTTSHRVLEIFDPKGSALGDPMAAPLIHGKQYGFVFESIRHFADCIISDQKPLVPGEDGLEVTRALCAAEESARTGQPVTISR